MRSMLLRNVAPNVMTKLARKLATSLMKVCTDSLTPVSQANAGLKVPRLERLASSERGSLTILLKHCENDPALIPSILSPKLGCSTIMGVHNNQDLIWGVKIGVYVFFWGPSWVLITITPRNNWY